MAADWGNIIPIELATKIVEHAQVYEDFETFSFVSSNWRSAAKQARFCGGVTVPWLLLPEDDNNSSMRRRRVFYSLYTHKSRHFDIPPSLCPDGCNDMRLLSSRRSLLSVSNYGEVLFLFDPLSGAAIQLPVARFHDKILEGIINSYNARATSFEKFILSANPSTTSNFTIAMILEDHTRMYFRSFFGVTMTTTTTTKIINRFPCQSRIPKKTKIFIIAMISVFTEANSRQLILITIFTNFDISHEIPQASLVLDLKRDDNVVYHKSSIYYDYLVEFGDRLLHVSRLNSQIVEGGRKCNCTISLVIHELNLNDGTATKVDDLGTGAIFVGSNSSFSVEAASMYGCKPNCVYYTDEHRFNISAYHDGKDIGLYNLANAETDSFYEGTPHFNEFTPLMRVESPSNKYRS